MKKFSKKLIKENKKSYSIEEKVNKDLAREDSLALIAEFVKNIKKKFDKNDILDILKDTNKTLSFYISEIENTSSSLDISPIFTPSMELDTIESNNFDNDSNDDSDDDSNDDISDDDDSDDNISDDDDSALSRILRRRSE